MDAKLIKHDEAIPYNKPISKQDEDDHVQLLVIHVKNINVCFVSADYVLASRYNIKTWARERSAKKVITKLPGLFQRTFTKNCINGIDTDFRIGLDQHIDYVMCTCKMNNLNNTIFRINRRLIINTPNGPIQEFNKHSGEITNSWTLEQFTKEYSAFDILSCKDLPKLYAAINPTIFYATVV